MLYLQCKSAHVGRKYKYVPFQPLYLQNMDGYSKRCVWADFEGVIIFHLDSCKSAKGLCTVNIAESTISILCDGSYSCAQSRAHDVMHSWFNLLLLFPI